MVVGLTILVFSVVYLHFQAARAATATCYFPDGSVDDSGVPCNSTGVSTCCQSGDACTTSGWCLGTSGYPLRSSCTSSSWSYPCLSYCTESSSVLQEYPSLLPCSGPGFWGQSWCCQPNEGVSCCDTNFTMETGFTGKAFIAYGDVESSTTSGTASTVTVTQTVTPTGTGTAQKSSSTGVAAGVGVAAAAGVLALGGATGWFWWRKKKCWSPLGHSIAVLRTDENINVQAGYAAQSYTGPTEQKYPLRQDQPIDGNPSPSPVELSVRSQPQELPDWQRNPSY